MSGIVCTLWAAYKKSARMAGFAHMVAPLWSTETPLPCSEGIPPLWKCGTHSFLSHNTTKQALMTFIFRGLYSEHMQRCWRENWFEGGKSKEGGYLLISIFGDWGLHGKVYVLCGILQHVLRRKRKVFWREEGMHTFAPCSLCQFSHS